MLSIQVPFVRSRLIRLVGSELESRRLIEGARSGDSGKQDLKAVRFSVMYNTPHKSEVED